ncbi:MAG: hypothetical protein WCA78_14080 [Rhizomicrobium sp.]
MAQMDFGENDGRNQPHLIRDKCIDQRLRRRIEVQFVIVAWNQVKEQARMAVKLSDSARNVFPLHGVIRLGIGAARKWSQREKIRSFFSAPVPRVVEADFHRHAHFLRLRKCGHRTNFVALRRVGDGNVALAFQPASDDSSTHTAHCIVLITDKDAPVLGGRQSRS